MEQNEYKREIVVFKEFFWDFYKKLNRTPMREIEKAAKLKTDYFNEKRDRL